MNIAIVKYNAGNIYSVDYALKRLGVEATITADKELLMKADKVIFPGVGEAETTMNYLKERGLDTLIKSLTQPVLGICLGMQMAVVEFARNVLNIKDANSAEFDENNLPKTDSPLLTHRHYLHILYCMFPVQAAGAG